MPGRFLVFSPAVPATLRRPSTYLRRRLRRLLRVVASFAATIAALSERGCFAIARNQLTDHFRSEQAHGSAVRRLGIERRDLTDAEYDRIEELAATHDLRELVAEELERLPVEQQDAVRLRLMDELSYEEVAERLGITQPAARARVSRGLRTLRAAVAVASDLPEKDMLTMPGTQETFEDLPILAELRASLEKAYALSDVPQPAGQPRHRKRPSGVTTVIRGRSRRLALAAGAVSSLAAVGVFGFQGGSVTPSAVAATMNHLARAAATQNWTGIPAPGKYLYTESRTAHLAAGNVAGCLVSYTEIDRIWIATDGAGATRSSYSDVRFASPKAQTACAAHGQPNPMSVADPDGVGRGTRFPAGGLQLPDQALEVTLDRSARSAQANPPARRRPKHTGRIVHERCRLHAGQ